MKKDRLAFLEEEEKILAPYAVKSSEPGEREHREEEHPYRLPFQRDKDRIIHSHAFKRLQYKTQVFLYSEGDHFRNRLTHTLEVAGIAKTVSKVLALNEDLTETIALAHDLGHSPFGHAGQDALAELMADKGGFEHNEQSLRVVRNLERRYPHFLGLNLCAETLLGIMKHGESRDGSALSNLRKENGPSLEALVVDISDEITYSAHDLEDGLERGLLDFSSVKNLSIWRRLSTQMKKYGLDTNLKTITRLVGKVLLNETVSNLIDATERRLNNEGIQSRSDVSKAFQKRIKLVGFDSEFQAEFVELKRFLFQNLYRHPEVSRMSDHGKETIHLLFKHFETHPESIPESYLAREPAEGKYRILCDYIAGMTDRYATQTLKKEGIFWFPY
ncbi:deoxyguanosinetriphosphate triphosphohydrolase [Leptospira sp. 96542]|nr:deoxyguanosinetriphosphate triphosphohydrolase [Leptospira sp. 96542]